MMPPPGLPHFIYCRPHVKTISPKMQFVVRTSRGIDIGTAKFAEGEEFPSDAVNEYTLRCLYEQLKIDLMPVDHPAFRGLQAARPVVPENLEALSHKQLMEWCRKLNLPAEGSKAELRERLQQP